MDLTKIYNENYQTVLMWIKNKINDDHVCQELANDVFLKVAKNIDKFDFKVKTTTWLYVIAKNIVIDYCRKKTLNTEPIEVTHVSSWNKTPEQILGDNEMRENILLKISKLDIKYREIARLYFINEYTYESISDELDMPLGSIKSIIFRIRKILQKELQTYRNYQFA